MRRLRERRWLKVLAFALLPVAALTFVLSARTLEYGYELDYYDTGTNFYKTSTCYACAYDYGWYISELYHTQMGDAEAARVALLNIQNEQMYSSFDCILYSCSEQGERQAQLLSTWSADQLYGASFSLQFSFAESDVFGEEAPWDGPGEIRHYEIEVYVTAPPRGLDRLAEEWQTYQNMQSVRPLLLPLLIGSGLLILLCLFWLLYVAWSAHGGQVAHPGVLSRLPLDLLVLLFLLGLSFVVNETRWFPHNQSAAHNFRTALLLLLSTLLGAGALSALVVQLRAGGWQKKTLVYRLGVLAGRALRLLPQVWRFVLLGAAALATEVLLVCLTCARPENVILLLVYNVLLLFALGWLAVSLQRLQKAGEELARGNIAYKLDTRRMRGALRQHGACLNAIGDGMAIAVEERMRSERLKTELITNVSHDIKTPLTSIVNYVDLLLREHSEEEEKTYLEVLQRQSARLKKLTEDLIEASKAMTGNITVELQRTNALEALNQALGEYGARMADCGLQVVTSTEEAAALADGRLLWRVLDNLLGNVCKYAMAGTRVYVELRREADACVICIKNVSREALNISAEELMERFVRGDTARTTEGSGLGLSIARSLTELQGGTFAIRIDGDLFCAEIRLRPAE